MKKCFFGLCVLFLLWTQSSVFAFGQNEKNQVTVSYSGKELRMYHPTKLIKALQLIDLSFSIPDQFQLHGSDPNYIPESLNIRGMRGVSDQFSEGDQLPLIIINGYEASISRLYDMDIQSVRQVRILKNASETAVHGIRATNGVIEIQTVLPRLGVPRLSYSMDAEFQKADLSSYDVMNAQEKLLLEKSVGMYDAYPDLYDERLQSVTQTGEEDWLKIPLTVPFSTRHRLSLDGGDDNLQYRATLLGTVGDVGVMKGSKRNIYAGSTEFYYTSDVLRISNELMFDQKKIENSPFEDFLSYAAINPYYKKNNSNGKAIAILGEGGVNEQVSPYYEESLGNFSKSTFTGVVDNLNINWKISRPLSLHASFTYMKDMLNREQFISPNSNIFRDIPADEPSLKGSYNIIKQHQTSYDGKLQVSYSEAKGLHAYQGTVGSQIFASTYYIDNYTGTGLANDKMSYISFAKRYAINSKPGGKEYYDRLLSGFVSGSYTYDERYGINASFRLDKSSLLAPQKRTAHSEAVSVEWNMHNESFFFLSEIGFVNSAVLHAGLGANAGFQFSYDQVNPVYNYDFEDPYFTNNSLALVTLRQLNHYNPSLKWRTDKNLNVGISTRLINRLSVRLEYYNTLSDDLISLEPYDVLQGAKVRYSNGGSIRNSGIEFSLKFDVLTAQDGVSLSVFANGLMNRNKLESMPTYAVENYNGNIKLDQFPIYQLRLSKETNGIYAFQSKGIDPVDGKEIFYTKTGQETKTPGVDDLIFAGNSMPDVSGAFGFSGGYRNWSLHTLMNYSLGATIMNLTKMMRVDAISLFENGPKMMNKKWIQNKEGGIYQGFDNLHPVPSSRFVETEHALTLSSLGLSYQFDQSFLQKIKIVQELRASVIGNNLFHLSSVSRERGWIYPYARQFTFSFHVVF